MKSTNEHPAVTFLKSLYQRSEQGFINIRFLPSGENQFISLKKISSIPAVLEAHKGQNAHFGVATRRDGDGTKEGIVEIPSLWCDVDTEGLGEEAKNEIRQRYQDFPLKPSVLLNSGGGIHIYWKLKTPATKQEIPLVEPLLKRIALYFGGDLSSTDASRILRIPKTLNYKYSPPREVTIIAFKPKKEYNVSDFDFLPSFKEAMPGEEKPPNPEGWRDEILEGVPEGQRNSSLTQLAGSYVGKRLSRNEILAILEKANSQFKPPLPFKEVESILDSVIKTDKRNHPEPLPKEDESKNHEHHFSLIQAKDILSTEEPETDWLWDGILPMGGMGLVIAKPKVGKTSLADRLAVAVSRGDDFLGRRTSKGTVVYLALEEKRGEIQKALSMLNVQDENLFFHFGPAPREAMQEVGPLIRETKAKLLVIDILQKFCRVRDLNDYAQVTRALEPLMATARELNCHILLTHHAGKKDRPDGDDILGSTGLLGGVDTSIHIKRRNKESRIVFTIQRYGDDLPETVVTLMPDGSLEATGSREEVEVEETLPLILEALETGPLTEKEIGERLEKGHSLVSKSLRKLVEQRKIKRTGKGKKGDPYIYEKDSLLLSSHIGQENRREMKSEDNPKESQGNISPNGWGKNQECQESFLTKKEEENGPSKGGLYEVMDDGQLIY